MKKIRLVITTVLLISVFFSSCAQPNKSSHNKKDIIEKNSTDTSKYVIIKYDSSFLPWVFKNVSPATLSGSEIENIETILKKGIDNYNIKQQEIFDKKYKPLPNNNFKLEDFIIDIKKYYSHYVPVINEKGEKEVWINCFCDRSYYNDWKKEILVVMDGGNCHFNVIINLTTKTYYKLKVNGNA
ncbi:MAG: hypothetical protein IPJ81_11040 [Chitinophagaceae bacterium]|nr:hypothetical protein [Chitinophagaceae bacterium]